MITKKGKKAHIFWGKIYVKAMWIVVISALLLCVKNIFIRSYESALFLGFLSLITSLPLWYGIVILKHKVHLPKNVNRIRLSINMSILALAVVMICVSIFTAYGHSLMLIFGGLGLTTLPDIISILKKTSPKRNFIQTHAVGMVTTAIAAYTAFFAFGGRTLLGEIFTGNLMIIPWVLPGILGTIANVYYSRKYANK